MSKVITSKNGQQFNAETAVIDSIRKGTNKDGSFVVVDLDNFESYAFPLNAISKATSHAIGWEHLPYLVDAKITYVTTERVAGQEFTFRPGDRRALVAENDGLIVSVIAIKPDKDVRSVFNALPLFESRAREKAQQEEPETEPETEPEQQQEPPHGTTTETGKGAGKGKNATE